MVLCGRDVSSVIAMETEMTWCVRMRGRKGGTAEWCEGRLVLIGLAETKNGLRAHKDHPVMVVWVIAGAAKSCDSSWLLGVCDQLVGMFSTRSGRV